MAVGSTNLTPEQLRGLEDEPLRDALTEAKKELFNLRFQSATGQLESHGRLRAVRKDIARIYTEMRERELGIGREPADRADTDSAQDEQAEKTTKEKVG
ncbi:MAG: 50S ribosomal protein L29 [Actinomycetota bacterium]|jgi:large subunit ribosomal protein L29|nr:50S ribosomal protein L29 [Actinomycetota bacterium]